MSAPTGPAASTPERTALYRLYDDMGQILYIGITTNPKRRWMEHASRYAKTWWPRVATRAVEWYDSREEASAAEKSAIRAEKPPYNLAHARSEAPDPARVSNALAPYLRIAGLLREAILAGDIPPGAVLPSEHQLADRYGFTRPTVRRGLAVLRAEGMIATFQGKGAFARQLPDRTIAVPVGHPEEAAVLLRERLTDADLVALTQALVAEIARK